MKHLLLITALSVFTASANAQTLQEAIKKSESERFENAAADFRSLILKESNKGENYFYYGENFFNSGKLNGFQNGELDSASYMYSKGVEMNATSPFNYIGLGKVLLAQNKINDAKAQFFKATSISQSKNAEVMRRIAEAWLATDNRNGDEAINHANSAIKLDPKNPDNYITLGDAQLEKTPTDGGTAIKSYKQATTLNPKSAKGIISEGKLYQRGRNYQLALDKYKEALGIDPTFAPAYREIAELYFLAGQNAKSIENWKKYLELNNSDFARYRFMSALYKNKQYSEAITEYENLKKSNFKNVYLDRIASYSYYEMGDKNDKDAYQKGSKALDDFFQGAGPNFKYLGSDFKYKGLLMMKTGKDSLGIIEMEKGISMDPASGGDIYGEIANYFYKSKRYDKSIEYFQKKIALDPKTIGSGGNEKLIKNLNNNDWFNLGRAYYFLGDLRMRAASAIKDAKQRSQKETEVMMMFAESDSAFVNLTLLSPSWPTGYIYRGRVNYSLDPKIERDDTRIQYEKVLEVIKPEEKATTYKKEAIEAYEYLGYYYVTKKDKAKADEMFKAIQELDPTNQKAKDYFAPPKPGAKPAGAK
jgi:tetratricopeptide (TPR) repeat protein